MQWHEASNKELAELPPDTPLRINKNDNKIKTLGHYADLYLPGGYHFLSGMAAVGWYVEVPDRVVE